MPTEQHNRDMKAALIEQVLVEAGHRRVTPEAREYARKTKISASEATWDRVQVFLADRFPTTDEGAHYGSG